MTHPLHPGALVSPSVRLVRPLGEGNMGSVWVGDHLGLETQVAVKFMSEALGADPATRARFAREAVAASRVKSPHVVQTFDHGVTAEGMPFIVMELLDGEDLAARMTRGLLSLPQVSALASQVCLALARAHAIGVVHRDIKPANIFLCDVGGGQPFVKLLDFGIAKTVHQPIAGYATSVGVPMGTPYYMSPEQFVDASQADSRSDLWSMAVVIYECLSGLMPFRSVSLGGLAISVSNGVFEPPSSLRPELPKVLDEWFLVALAKNPDDRFQTAKDFAERLAAVTAAAARGLGDSKMSSLPPVSDLAHAAWASAPHDTGSAAPSHAAAPTGPPTSLPMASSDHAVAAVEATKKSSLTQLGRAATLLNSDTFDHTLPAAARAEQARAPAGASASSAALPKAGLAAAGTPKSITPAISPAITPAFPPGTLPSRDRLHATTGAAGVLSSELPRDVPASTPSASAGRPRVLFGLALSVALVSAAVGGWVALGGLSSKTTSTSHGTVDTPVEPSVSIAQPKAPPTAPPSAEPTPSVSTLATTSTTALAAPLAAPSPAPSAEVPPTSSAKTSSGRPPAASALRPSPAHLARPTSPSTPPATSIAATTSRPPHPPTSATPGGLDGLTGMGLQ